MKKVGKVIVITRIIDGKKYLLQDAGRKVVNVTIGTSDYYWGDFASGFPATIFPTHHLAELALSSLSDHIESVHYCSIEEIYIVNPAKDCHQ